MTTDIGMGACCMSGVLQQGTPKGMVKEIAGLQTYVAEPEDGDKTKTVIFLVESVFQPFVYSLGCRTKS